MAFILACEFKAGINTETCKYYIDFASANKLKYAILDEGWSDEVNLKVIKP
jgi:alpha-glucosidase